MGETMKIVGGRRKLGDNMGERGRISQGDVAYLGLTAKIIVKSSPRLIFQISIKGRFYDKTLNVCGL